MLKALLGWLKPDRENVRARHGRRPPLAIRARIGYMPGATRTSGMNAVSLSRMRPARQAAGGGRDT